MKFEYVKNLGAIALCFGLVSVCAAQTAPATPDQPATPAAQTPVPAAAPAAPAAPAPLSSPAMTGPLSNIPPAVFDAGFLGKLSVNGIVSGFGMWQGNHVPGDNPTQAALDNGQIFIQKADGWFQFYVQAGAYTLPALGTPFLSTDKSIGDLFGAVPEAYIKFQPGKNTAIEIGSLPTLIGAEYTFTFENMNIERGLLWNQENVINKGIQIAQTMGKFTASLSWNDGFYSNRYSWITGSLAYANGPHSLSFVAGGNVGQTAFQTYAVPVQNNSSIYNIIYTYTKGNWIVNPYFQYTDVPTNVKIGIVNGASTAGGAAMVSYAFKHGFSLPARFEFIATTGDTAHNSVNLLYGPGSQGLSFTLSPTFQSGGFFVRGDLSWVHAANYTNGDGFGPTGANRDQPRAVAEIGFIFGNNIVEKK